MCWISCWRRTASAWWSLHHEAEAGPSPLEADVAVFHIVDLEIPGDSLEHSLMVAEAEPPLEVFCTPCSCSVFLTGKLCSVVEWGAWMLEQVQLSPGTRCQCCHTETASHLEHSVLLLQASESRVSVVAASCWPRVHSPRDQCGRDKSNQWVSAHT